MRLLYFRVLCFLLLVTCLCNQQGNLYNWGGGEFTFFTAPTPSFPDQTFTDIYLGTPFVVKSTNGTLFFLKNTGIEPVPYKETDTKVMCTVQSSSPTYAVINEQGDLYTWGSIPGDGTPGPLAEPVKLQGLLQGKVVTQCSATTSSISVVTSDSEIYSWGYGTQGQLGNGNSGGSYLEQSPVATTTTGVLNGKTIEEIQSSSGAVFVLADDKRIYSWGKSTDLGTNSASLSATPVAVDWSGVLNGKEAKQLFASDSSGFVVTSDNQLYAWGSNAYGLVSGPTGSDQQTPVAVDTTLLENTTIHKVYVGTAVLFIETADNRLFGAGRNGYHQISADSATSANTPLTEIDLSALPSGVTIQKVVSSAQTSAILGSDSKLYMWGDVRPSGRPTEKIPYLPHVQKVSFNMNDISRVYMGADYTAAVTNNNRLFLWGKNSVGQLGQGNTENSGVPVEVTGYDIRQVAVHGRAILLLTTQGTVYGWGGNSNGVIGDGTTTNRLVPTQLETNGISIGKIEELSLGPTHALALSSDNILYAWGSNNNGQLGVGDKLSRQYLVAVDMRNLGGEKVEKFYAVESYSLLLTKSGKLYGWGTSSLGLLMNGLSGGSILIPTRLNNLNLFDSDPIVKISASGATVLVLTKSRKIFGWGMNDSGQLGTGTSSTRELTPVQVNVAGTGLEGKTVVQIHADYYRSYALTSDGLVFGWGISQNLGIEVAVNQRVPVLLNLSNIPTGKYITFVTGSSIMGLVVQNAPPTALVCVEGLMSCIPTCYGISATSPNVCSSRGSCIADDYCKCNQGWGGYACQRICANCYLNYN